MSKLLFSVGILSFHIFLSGSAALHCYGQLSLAISRLLLAKCAGGFLVSGKLPYTAVDEVKIHLHVTLFKVQLINRSTSL